MDPSFAPFIASGVTWKKHSSGSPNRGLVDDPDGANKKTAAQKVISLNLMLEQISSWCPYIARTFIVKNSTSLSDVWRIIREHYDFLSSGSQFLDLSLVKMEPHEPQNYRLWEKTCLVGSSQRTEAALNMIDPRTR